MWRPFTEALDRAAIRSACSSIAPKPSGPSHVEEAVALVASPDFLKGGGEELVEPRFNGNRAFEFKSPMVSPWVENNQVKGKLYRAGQDWRSKPSIILLHGWNGEAGYYWQFPYLAWRLNRAGLNAAMIELPYHGQRRPRAPGAIQNFLSHDLLSVAQATRQSIADTRALMRWLEAQGSPRVGVWGVSLGAWLAGLLASVEPRLAAAALLTPVVRMDRAFAELEFCAPIREGLGGAALGFAPLNLVSHSLAIPPEQVLIVKSEYDLFASAGTLNELWEKWGHPEMWATKHGHISVLLSLPVLERIVRWCGERVR